MSMAERSWWLKNNYDVFCTVDIFLRLNSMEIVVLLRGEKFDGHIEDNANEL